MAPTVDSNEVRITGENSFMRLATKEGGDFTTTISHWRALYSPGGPGHVVFIRSELTNNEVAVYSDNIALARWLQGEIESMITPAFANTSLPVVEAVFERDGDVRSFSTEQIVSDDADIALTWYDFLEPIAVHSPPGTAGRSHGVYTILIPARRARAVINGQQASGTPQKTKREDRDSTSACLAWSETWVRPRK